MSYASFRSPSKPLFFQLRILNIFDLVKLQNMLFIHQSLNFEVPPHIFVAFKFTKLPHNVNTRGKAIGLLSQCKVNTNNYGIFSVSFQAISCWNFFQCQFSNLDLASVSYRELKTRITDYYKQSYGT
jgi:hypothetical protein